jgi:hypothetical protein
VVIFEQKLHSGSGRLTVVSDRLWRETRRVMCNMETCRPQPIGHSARLGAKHGKKARDLCGGSLADCQGRFE